MCLLTFWIEKKHCKSIRTSVYEERKFCFVCKGVKSIVFVKNLRFIKLLFLCKIDKEKVSGDDLVSKKVFCNPL